MYEICDLPPQKKIKRKTEAQDRQSTHFITPFFAKALMIQFQLL